MVMCPAIFGTLKILSVVSGGYKMRIMQMHKVSFNDFFFSALAMLSFLCQNIVIIFYTLWESRHGV